MLRTILISLALVFAVPTHVHAEISTEDNQAINAKMDAFFKDLNAGQTQLAYHDLMLPVASESPDNMKVLIETTDKVVAYMGTPLKYEVIKQVAKGDQLVYREYNMYNDKLPYKVRVVMFRTSTGWRAQALYLKDFAIDEFAEGN